MIVSFFSDHVLLTYAQTQRLRTLLDDLGATEVHHGDNPGADEQFNRLAAEKHIPIYKHTARVPYKQRGHTQHGHKLAPKSIAERNRDLLAVCDVIVRAVPSKPKSQREWFGTDAYHAGRVIYAVHPDGRLEIQ